MTEEQRYQIEPNNEQPEQQLKFSNQRTTIFTKHKNASLSTLYDLQAHFQISTDTSFDQGIHEENMSLLKQASVKLLDQCLVDSFNKSQGFRDTSLYVSLPLQLGGENQLEDLINHNQLLGEIEKQEIVNMIKEEDELIGMLRKITPVFGRTVGKELIYIIHEILKVKLPLFRKTNQTKESILPKFNCFIGFQNEQNIQLNCPIYQDIDLEEVAQFAQNDLIKLSSLFYFSRDIKYLNLRELKSDIKPKVSVLQKFQQLVKQISRTIFFTIIGAVEQISRFQIVDFSQEVSFGDIPQYEGSVRRLTSRALSFDDEPQDFISKKLKFDLSID